MFYRNFLLLLLLFMLFISMVVINLLTNKLYEMLEQQHVGGTNSPPLHLSAGKRPQRLQRRSKLLPKRLITVFGGENSGSTFMAAALGAAMGAPFTHTDNVSKIRSKSASGDVEIQHVSLPSGWGGCTLAPIPTVDVFLPEECSIVPVTLKESKATYAQLKQSLPVYPDDCRDLTGKTDYFHYHGKFNINVTSHIQWYRERGVEATAVVMMRDRTIQHIAKIKGHCPNEQAARTQNQVAHDVFKQGLNVLPPNQVVVVSYEGLMLLQKEYLLDVYRQLRINSSYIPEFKDGNEKYLLGKKKQQQGGGKQEQQQPQQRPQQRPGGMRTNKNR